jgi:uncharacterized RDD family membrane protein YckC
MDQVAEALHEIEPVEPPPAPSLRPAGFWRRAGALILDYVFLVILFGVASGAAAILWGEAGRTSRVLHVAMTAFQWFLPLLYSVLFHWLWGQTMGKMLVGARVVTLEGRALSFGRALGRTVAWVLAALPVGAGLAVAALRRDRRGLHDLLAGTRVERV